MSVTEASTRPPVPSFARETNHWPLGRRPDDHPGLSELGL